jgi:hypothetical protein
MLYVIFRLLFQLPKIFGSLFDLDSHSFPLVVLFNSFFMKPFPLSPISINFDNRRMPSSGLLCHVPLVKTDISEERIASIIRVTIDELGTTTAFFLVTAVKTSNHSISAMIVLLGT